MIKRLFGQNKTPAGIVLRGPDELAALREAGRIVARVHEAMRQAIRPGVSTAELDAIAEDVIRSNNATPTFLGYHGFPASICTSINDEIVHGIPSPDRLLKDGDIISVDVGATYHGWVGDSAWTYAVGRITPEAQRLLKTTEGALWAGIDHARANARLGDVSAAIQQYAESRGFAIVREYGGHGVGRRMHEPPQILNYGRPGTGLRLQPGLCFALEPMITAGHWLTQTDADGWTVRTRDGSLSAHFEHTLAVTTGEPMIMTTL